MLGTFTYNTKDRLPSPEFNVINVDVDEGGYTYYLLEDGVSIAYEYEGTFEPLIEESSQLPEEDGWGIVDTLTDEDK